MAATTSDSSALREQTRLPPQMHRQLHLQLYKVLLLLALLILCADLLTSPTGSTDGMLRIIHAVAEKKSVQLSELQSRNHQLVVVTQKQVEGSTSSQDETEQGRGVSGQQAIVDGGSVQPEDTPFLFLPVPINKADKTLLMSVSGIGPSTAARIIAHRKKYGPFKGPDDLLKIHGIGPQKLKKYAYSFSFEFDQ